MTDDEDGKGFTPSNLIGCAIGGLLFLWLLAITAMAFGMGCQPDMPCWADNRLDLLATFVIALIGGVLGGWGTAKLIRWIARRFHS